MPVRFKLPALVGGLDSLTDPLVGNLARIQDGANVRVNTGLIKQRPGFRMLDKEPSYLDSILDAKTAMQLSFTFGSAHYATTGTITAAKRFTLGTKWTLILEMATLPQSANEASGTYEMARVFGTTYDPIIVQVQGNGTQTRINVIIKDTAGTTVTLNSQYQTAAQWLATLSSRTIRVTRNGNTHTLYISEATEDTDTTALVGHEETTQVRIGHTTAASVPAASFYGLTLVNRVLSSESDIYWGINWPTDPDVEDVQILCAMPAIQGTGSTITDWTQYGNNLTITSASWIGGSVRSARGLGIHTHRLRTGEKWQIVACGATGTTSSGAAPSGVVYAWKADRDFYPFYFGGVSTAFDGTAGLTGLNYLARCSILSYRDHCYLMNGEDYARKGYLSSGSWTWAYLGGSAPAVAPVVAVTAGASNWTYCYTLYNSTTGTETGASPTAAANSATTGTTVQTWASLDTQFNKARIYRTVSGGTIFYQVGEVNVGAAFTEVAPNTDTAIVDEGKRLAGGDAFANLLVKRSYVPGAPLVAPTMAGVAGGGSVDTGLHYYAYSWYNSTTLAETGLSPAVAATTTAGNNTVPLTVIQAPPSGTAYDQMRIYRTKAGAYTWFLVTSTTAATTYTDTAADSTLTTATLEQKALPPKCKYQIVFAGRVWAAGDPDNPSTVYWSVAGKGEDFTWTAAHIPNPGTEITGLSAVEESMQVHYADGRLFGMQHPGNNNDLELFVPVNMREISPTGASIGHYTIQRTPYGLIWLGRDGFYRFTGQGLELISPTITPTFLDLNRQRARYACALYNDSQQTYTCWLSQSNERLNESPFTLDLRTFTWIPDDAPHADAAAVMLDGQEKRHYVVLQENGVMAEFDSETRYQDGDGSGTLSGTVAGATIFSFTDIAGRTAPTGEDSGYPIWFVKSDLTSVQQRWVINAGQGIVAGKVNFYPSLQALTSGTWTAYVSGIRGRFRTMKTDCDDPRPDKTFMAVYISHAKESAGTMRVLQAVNDGSQAAANGTAWSLTDNMTSQCNIQTAGRVIDLEMIHHPPASGEGWKIFGLELEGEFEGADTA